MSDIIDERKSMNENRKKLGLPPIHSRSETLLVGVDFSHNGDISVITTGRLEDMQMVMKRVVLGEKAEKLYKMLTDETEDI